MEIRPLRDNEEERIKNFIVWILEKEFTTRSEEYPDQDLDNLKKIYQQPGCVLLILEEEGHLVGTIAIKNENKDTALVRRLFVHPAYRHRGFGSALLNRAIDFCRLNGYKKVIFRSTSEMSSAISLCLKHGFKERERIALENFEMVGLDRCLT